MTYFTSMARRNFKEGRRIYKSISVMIYKQYVFRVGQAGIVDSTGFNQNLLRMRLLGVPLEDLLQKESKTERVKEMVNHEVRHTCQIVFKPKKNAIPGFLDNNKHMQNSCNCSVMDGQSRRLYRTTSSRGFLAPLAGRLQGRKAAVLHTTLLRGFVLLWRERVCVFFKAVVSAWLCQIAF